MEPITAQRPLLPVPAPAAGPHPEPVDTVCLSDSHERQLQHELLAMRLYARAGRTRPELYAPQQNLVKCLQPVHN